MRQEGEWETERKGRGGGEGGELPANRLDTVNGECCGGDDTDHGRQKSARLLADGAD